MVIALVLSFAGLAVCASVAGTKQRNAIAWGAAGFFFPLIAVIAVLVVGPQGTAQIEEGRV